MKKYISLSLLMVSITLFGCQSPAPVENTEKQQPVENNQEALNPEMHIALVALEDNGQAGDLLGCGDSLVFEDQPLGVGQDALTESLNFLLAINTQNYGTYYNSLGNSQLVVDSIVESGTNVTVNLSGTISLGGVCDNPRFEEQITRTVEENTTLTPQIFLNGQTLEDALSLA